jgi:hypothetical protein
MAATAAAGSSDLRRALLAGGVLAAGLTIGCGDDSTGPDQNLQPLTAEVPVAACYGIHDTYVRDGIAFVAAWNSGLLIYDVGNGIAGGSPTSPQLVSEVVPGGSTGCAGGARTHNSWWFHDPETGEARYLFVGQEGPGSVGSTSSGDIFVIDVSDLTNPVEVASYHRDDAGTHNFWVDDENAILYAAYYNGGVVAFDVSGTLPADLSTREIARTLPGGEGRTFTWGVMLHDGALYAADMISGFHKLQLEGTSFVHAGGGNNVEGRFTSDLWVRGDYAYTGTWGVREAPGNTVYIWTVSPAAPPALVDSLQIPDVITVSDVEVSPDGTRLLVTAECGSCAAGGLYVYDLADPRNPERVGRYPVNSGLHTGTFAEIDGELYVFGARNPASPSLMIFAVDALEP